MDIDVQIISIEEHDALLKATRAKREEIAGKETMEEAWKRVFGMKNSAKDMERLQLVKTAYEEGRIGRLPDKVGKKFSKSEAMTMWKTLERQEIEEVLRDMTENVPDNYKLITDVGELNKVVDIMLAEELIVFDVESTGVNVFKDKLVGHVLTATSLDIHYYIPTGHKDPRKQLEETYVLDKLKPVYEDKHIKKIAHNAKFDYQMLRKAGISVENIYWDTQEAMKILNENEESYALKPLTDEYLKIDSYGYAELFGKDTGFQEVPLDTALAYAAKDGDITFKMYEFQMRHLKKMPEMLEYFMEVEMSLLPQVAEMELEGYPIDLKYASEYAKELREETEVMEKEIVEEFLRDINKDVAGEEDYEEVVEEPQTELNLRSPQQLKKAIEAHVGHPIKNTDAKQTLKPLAKKYPLIERLLDYRGKAKLLGTYIEALPNMIEESTGRLHGTFFQNGTVTGRFSAEKPNMQNQNDESRRMFIAPKGYVLVNADFSAQEVRCIASLSREEVLLKAFREGLDPYAMLASEFFNLPYVECYKNPDGSDTKPRVQMKLVLLMSLYGASKYGLATALGITVDDAEKFRKDFFNRYKNIDAFINRAQDFAKKHGYVWIGGKKRKRRLPEAQWTRKPIPYGKWADDEYEEQRIFNSKISRAMRQGPNAMVQGESAIQTKVTMIEAEKVCKERGWIPFACVHDELLYLIPENQLKEDIPVLEKIMTESYKFDGVDNGSDIELQYRWGESISYADYLAGKEIPKL